MSAGVQGGNVDGLQAIVRGRNNDLCWIVSIQRSILGRTYATVRYSNQRGDLQDFEVVMFDGEWSKVTVGPDGRFF